MQAYPLVTTCTAYDPSLPWTVSATGQIAGSGLIYTPDNAAVYESPSGPESSAVTVIPMDGSLDRYLDGIQLAGIAHRTGMASRAAPGNPGIPGGRRAYARRPDPPSGSGGRGTLTTLVTPPQDAVTVPGVPVVPKLPAIKIIGEDDPVPVVKLTPTGRWKDLAKEFELVGVYGEENLTVGRSLASWGDHKISRNHYSVAFDRIHQHWIISDAGSKFGTFVNGEKLNLGEKRVLRNDDVIGAGQTEWRFAEEVIDRRRYEAIFFEKRLAGEAPDTARLFKDMQAKYDRVEFLRWLADLPDIPMRRSHPLDLAMTMMNARETHSHRFDRSFQYYLASILSDIYLDAVRGGRLPAKEFWELARRAGFHDVGIAQQLAMTGFGAPFDFVPALRFLLATAKQGGRADARVIEYIIHDLVRWVEGHTSPNDSALIRVLAHYNRQWDGGRLIFPSAYRVFIEYLGPARHALKSWYTPEQPHAMLNHLLEPGQLRLNRELIDEDPTLAQISALEGEARPQDIRDAPSYTAAVYELGKVVTMMGEEGRFLDGRPDYIPLPITRLPPYEDLSDGARLRLVRALRIIDEFSSSNIGVENDRPLAISSDPSSTTAGQADAYRLQADADKALYGKHEDLSLPSIKWGEEREHDGWIWRTNGLRSAGLKDTEIGRFNFAVIPDHALKFWVALTEKLERMPMWYQARVAFDRPTPIILFFAAQDHVAFYELAVEVAREHPEWFSDDAPLFAARMFDRQGDAVKGLSFAQNPAGPESYSEIIADALMRTSGLRRMLRVLGITLTDDIAVRLLAQSLEIVGIYPARPAFTLEGDGQRTGNEIFPDIWQHSDQYDGSKSQAGPTGPKMTKAFASDALVPKSPKR